MLAFIQVLPTDRLGLFHLRRHPIPLIPTHPLRKMIVVKVEGLVEGVEGLSVDVDEGNVFGVMPLTTISLPVLRKQLKNQNWGILAHQSVYLVICTLVKGVSMDARL
jgi:hypothetical protein